MSELVKSAQSQLQDITGYGNSVAVVISRETFNWLWALTMALEAQMHARGS